MLVFRTRLIQENIMPQYAKLNGNLGPCDYAAIPFARTSQTVNREDKENLFPDDHNISKDLLGLVFEQPWPPAQAQTHRRDVFDKQPVTADSEQDNFVQISQIFCQAQASGKRTETVCRKSPRALFKETSKVNLEDLPHPGSLFNRSSRFKKVFKSRFSSDVNQHLRQLKAFKSKCASDTFDASPSENSAASAKKPRLSFSHSSLSVSESSEQMTSPSQRLQYQFPSCPKQEDASLLMMSHSSPWVTCNEHPSWGTSPSSSGVEFNVPCSLPGEDHRSAHDSSILQDDKDWSEPLACSTPKGHQWYKLQITQPKEGAEPPGYIDMTSLWSSNSFTHSSQQKCRPSQT